MTAIRDLAGFNAVHGAGLAKLLPPRPRIAVGMGTCGSGNGAEAVYARLRRGHRPARPRHRSGAHRLLRLLRRGAAGQRLACRASRWSSCTACRSTTSSKSSTRLAAKTVPADLALCRIEEWDHLTSHVHYGSRLPRHPAVERGAFLPRPEEDRPAQRRADQSRRHRGVHRRRRLPGAVQGADRRHARGGQRADQGIRPARARRRRLLDRHEMGVPAQGRGRAQVPHLQRRRGRSRRLHEPQRDRERSARPDRGHGDRRLHHRRHATASSTSAPNIRWPCIG